jgi:hypothetical protein
MAEGMQLRFRAGDEFRVVRGSKAGGLGVTGTLVVEAFDGEVAQIAVSVGKFGFNVGVDLRLEREGELVAITATGRAFDEIRREGRIEVDTPGELRIADTAGELDDLHLQVADDGTATVDAELPKVGVLHLQLEPA